MSRPKRPKQSVVHDPTAPPLEVEGQFREITARTNQETDQSQQKLASAKDKAQLSTTGSLSLTLIVVLKQLLEDVTSGHGDTMMYISLTLVGMCLCFQVAIAFLAIYVYSQKNTAPVPDQGAPPSVQTKKQAKYSERIFRTSSDPDLRDSRSEQGISPDEEEGESSRDKRSLTSHIFQLFRDLDSSTTEQPWYVSCCPCCHVSASETEERYSLCTATTRMHDILTIEKVKASMEFAEAQANLSHFGLILAEDIDSKDPDPETEKLEKKFEEKWKQLNTVTTQHKLLDLQLDLDNRRKAFKKLYSYQQNLTYLTYVVFVMNSFITGFGLTRGVEVGGANNATMPVGVSG